MDTADKQNLSQTGKEIEEYYERFVLNANKNNANKNKDPWYTRDDIHSNTNNFVSFLDGDYNEFKKFMTNEVATLKDAFTNLNFIKPEEKMKANSLELENKILKDEVLELREMVSKLVENLCKNNEAPETKGSNQNFSRQNQSTISYQNKLVENSSHSERINNNDRNDMNKWLIPKRTSPPINVNTNVGN